MMVRAYAATMDATLPQLPVADEWWEVERFDHGVVLLTEPHVHPLLRCNVWLVQGSTGSVVIDTALGLRPLRTLVEQHLDGPLLAVATHAHGDHVGGLHEFDRRAVHAAEADVVAETGVTTLVTRYFPPTVTGPYLDDGYDMPELLLDAVPGAGFDPRAVEIAPAAATRVLHDGDVIDLGDRRFEVLHLPGHSPGSIGLWDAGTGTLFSGDAVYDGPLLDELDGSDIDAYLSTMARLRDLAVTVVHGGHEPSFDRARLVELCDTYLAHRSR
jgi:glyoxylase-like metal-dependent hydrolase (beta-lactamase superfamily II)